MFKVGVAIRLVKPRSRNAFIPPPCVNRQCCATSYASSLLLGVLMAAVERENCYQISSKSTTTKKTRTVAHEP